MKRTLIEFDALRNPIEFAYLFNGNALVYPKIMDYKYEKFLIAGEYRNKILKECSEYLLKEFEKMIYDSTK